jgi:hypothetical protein
MSAQLEDLMKRAGEARTQKRQREFDRKFFAWFEDTFNIYQYDKTDAYGKPAALVDNALVFVRRESEEMSADVYSKCHDCKNEVHNFGVARNLEELGERLRLDEQGNFPAICEYFLIGQPQTPVNALLSNKAEAVN